MKKKGIVYLVGAGPGDAGLITVKGLNRLREADVVLHDNLANSILLTECKSDCEKIFVGKEAGLHHVTQDKTTELLINKAKKGKKVVRLKGGDPLIFGRGSEEAIALQKAGIDFEIIPGVTAASGASAYAGIPLTHRNLVAQTVFVTAHEQSDKTAPKVDWHSLAKMKNTTLVIYMGVSQIQSVTEKLITAGMSENTSASVIENATLNSQRTFVTTIKELSKTVESNNVKPPAIFIIGPTGDSYKQMGWFENKPLHGKRIVCTRAEDQSQSLFNLLNEKGTVVVPFSTIKTKLSIPKMKIKTLFLKHKFDWIVFSSENGVRYFYELLRNEILDSRLLSGIKVAAIGSGTGKKLNEHGIQPDFVPKNFTSESLVKELSKKVNLKGKNILRVKGNFLNDPLTEGLSSCGAKVTTYEVYKTFKAKPDKHTIKDLLNKKADAVLFTSMSTVTNFFDILGNNKSLALLNNSITLAIGPVTAEELNRRGVKKVCISKVHTIDGMVEELVRIITYSKDKHKLVFKD
ncbi:MAG: uroporphyrinogen-III C-methyltransferase [Bacteroidetes bacterium]|nr:MAG: uroporphyrinogen-III C-methyltransferase [Bacteroidota bacterium]